MIIRRLVGFGVKAVIELAAGYALYRWAGGPPIMKVYKAVKEERLKNEQNKPIPCEGTVQ